VTAHFDASPDHSLPQAGPRASATLPPHGNSHCTRCLAPIADVDAYLADDHLCEVCAPVTDAARSAAILNAERQVRR
jgi:hypothetical protein